jgi:hypothetical protein
MPYVLSVFISTTDPPPLAFSFKSSKFSRRLLRIAPTNLQSKMTLRVNDYGKKN